MPNIPKIEIKDLLKRLEKFKKNLGLVFWLIFIVLLFFELITVKTLVGQILDSYKDPDFVIKDKGVRLDFEGYNRVVDRINSGQRFRVEDRIEYNPFGQGQ